MAILEILKYPHPILKTKASPVNIIDNKIRSLIDNMIETMYHAKGIGLAANQVGVEKRVIVLDVPDENGEDYKTGKNLIKIINPEIFEQEGEIRYEEGCLSIPGFTGELKRFERLKVKGLDRDGNEITVNAEGLLAIALQHEIDHLNGMLFIDRLGRLKRELLKKRILKTFSKEKAL